MSVLLLRLLRSQAIQPVLVDIGASGVPPEIWKAIAAESTYVGFDPDLRELREADSSGYRKAYVVNEAVVPGGESDVQLYLTRSPYCSSTLAPDAAALGDHIFADLFAVEREVHVKATSLEAVAARLGLSRVDWLKTDSQGLDLRVFSSLSAPLRNRVLALDVEPGLIDVYQGEDGFADAHKHLAREGFWLSNLDVRGTVRMRQTTLKWLQSEDSRLTRAVLERGLRPSPGWCNARYLRTLNWLEQTDKPRDYVLLWAFATLDRQYGFALDTALEYQRRFGPGQVGDVLRNESVRRLRKRCRGSKAVALCKRSVPSGIMRRAVRLLGR